MTKTRDDRIPPGQQLVAPGKWPLIGERQPMETDTPWSLQINGEVEHSISLSLEDLQSLPQTKQTMDIHCVTRWSMLDVTFSGVLLKDLLTETGAQPNAKFVSFRARSKRNHATSLNLETAINLNTLIATEVNGEPTTAPRPSSPHTDRTCYGLCWLTWPECGLTARTPCQAAPASQPTATAC